MRSASRRQFLAAAGLTAAGCSPAPRAGEFAGQDIRVFVYAGGHEATMRAAFAPQFEAATGATVTLYAGWWDAIAKLKATGGDPPFDLMITDATQGYPAAKAGLFAQLDLANIPNANNLVPMSRDNWISRDRYGVVYPDAVMTLAYHEPQVSNPPTRWAELLRPDLAGKLGLYRSFYMSLYTFACMLVDADGKPGTAAERIVKDIDDVFKFAREHRSKVKVWWPNTTDMMQALRGRDCAAGNMQSPEYLHAMKDQPELAAAVPAADRAFVQVFWAVPAGVKNQRLAEKAIDFLFSDAVQLEFARRGSASAIPAVAAQVAAEDPLWKSLYPHAPEQFNTIRYYPYEFYAQHWDRLADEWDRTVLRG